MTPALASLYVLVAAAADPSAAPSPDRTIELMIAGPEALRAQMEASLRPLIGDDPGVRWVLQDSLPGGEPPLDAKPEGGAYVWIDVASPTRIRVYLPGCSSATAANLRTVEGAGGEVADVVGRETVAQIVKAAVQVLRTDAPPSVVCEIGRGPGARPAAATALHDAGQARPERGRRMWLGMGGGLGWGYVPQGKLEWEERITVQSQLRRPGSFHLLPEVGYMLSDNFAVAAQVRLEFISQREATYRDPTTGELMTLAGRVNGEPESRAIAGLLRAIWYHDLSDKGDLRLSLSADLGAGHVRFPVAPVVTFYYDPTAAEQRPDMAKTIAKTDTRPMGLVLFGGSAGILWNLSRHFALALDARVLSGLPDWGALVEGQLSAQVGL